MQISKGVEWAVHAASLMSALPENQGLKAETLASFHGVPKAYMAKQLQALSKAGLVRTSRGAHGGYRLAMPASDISLWDITVAIEGNKSAFRCTEIRQNGPCALKPKDCSRACPIAAAFMAAEKAFRDSLASVSLAAIGSQVMAESTPDHLLQMANWLNEERIVLSNAAE